MAQLVVIAAMLAGCASTASVPSGYMALGERTAPPAGFVDFCARQPNECGLKILARNQDIKAALYNRYLWSVAFHTPDQEVRTAAAPQVDAAAPTPTGLLSYAMQPRLGAADAQDDLQRIAWGRAPPPPGASATQPSDQDDVEIQETRSAPQQLPLNPATMDELNMVNRLVNEAIVFAPDTETYGVEDYWAEPLEAGIRRGDCEDYALEKRRALIARGVPEAALSIAVVRTRRGEGHAVLLVATDQGELVLDSLTPWVVAWQEAPYEWVERQTPGEPMVWVRTGSTPRQLPVMETAAPRLAPAAG